MDDAAAMQGMGGMGGGGMPGMGGMGGLGGMGGGMGGMGGGGMEQLMAQMGGGMGGGMGGAGGMDFVSLIHTFTIPRALISGQDDGADGRWNAGRRHARLWRRGRRGR